MFLPIRDDNPHDTSPIVNYAVIAICVAVFLWQLSLGDRGGEVATYMFGVIPARLLGHIPDDQRLSAISPLFTIFTSMFMHGGWMHLIGNMWFLWLFGDNIEASFGHARYALFYLLCGIIAALAQSFASPESAVPMIGASGAISGVLGAYLILHPRANIRVLVFLIFIGVINLPAFIVLGGWFAMQLLSSASVPAGQPGVAFIAHIGGFVGGMILVFLFRRREVRVFQPPVSRPFAVQRRGHGSVPDSGYDRRGPWG